MNCKVYSTTHVGKRRKNNQDSILVNTDLNLYAVADGMGGHKGGEVASAKAIEVLENYMLDAVKKKDFFPEVALMEAFQIASNQVYLKSRENELALAGMGTTLVACFIWQSKIFFANVGDSRAYLFRDPYLWRVTEDHSVINEQLKKGLISEDQAGLLEDTNVITRSIGFMPDVEVDVFEKKILPKDFFMLCSDGLSGMVPDKEICEISRNNSLEKVTERYLQQALDAGGDDNISIIVISPELK